MTDFNPYLALLGGALIGLAATLLLWMNGRVAGISGIFGGIVVPRPGEVGWRVAFVGGLIVGGLVMATAIPQSITYDLDRSNWALVAAGLVVGVGTRLGSGCTSGHGVCGLSRLSTRSLGSVLTFMLSGAIVVYLVRTVFGGSL